MVRCVHLLVAGHAMLARGQSAFDGGVAAWAQSAGSFDFTSILLTEEPVELRVLVLMSQSSQATLLLLAGGCLQRLLEGLQRKVVGPESLDIIELFVELVEVTFLVVDQCLEDLL